ncbi:unnamed protein product [Cuscuta epithymum]|uniref:Pectin acetylesterase n=1 Tax=Cuscuta epithymum TaxID=186058 RepID=A0AAV0CHQ7_9ASTE|nr:unnamed protein product [Cuscuta epithymum]
MEISATMLYCFLLCAALVVGPSKGIKNVTNTVLHSAVAEGAVCLDGSPPVYNWDSGKGSGARNWLVHLGGGGWCINSTIYDNRDYAYAGNCSGRARTGDGSSLHMVDYFEFKGIFGDLKNESYFYNWNRVVVRYCDGGSFSGDVDQPDPLFYRGARIYRAVVKELMTKGMKDAKNVILAGGSAGGIGAMIHCGHFRSLFHPSVNVKCYIDSSLFLKLNNPKDAKFFKTVFGMVVKLQESVKSLPQKCTSERSATSVHYINTTIRSIYL